VADIGGALRANLFSVERVPVLEAPWFAVQTKPQHEKKVAAALEEKGVAAFLPLLSALHQWSDRRRRIDTPLFPGYVFVRVGSQQGTRVPILQTMGVLRFVGSRGIGVPIPDEQIESVRKVLKQGTTVIPYPYLTLGQKVRIRGGCFDGIEGYLAGANGDRSLVISVEGIQRSLAIRIAGYELEAA
jgi:transcription antitermination factor NusG